jgi:hypothetical protein
MRIKKIIFEDDSEESIKDYKTREQSKDIWEYQRQFFKFDKEIIEHIDEDVISDYAEYNLSMVDEDSILERSLYDFTDKEVREYCKKNNLLELGELADIVNNHVSKMILDDMIGLFRKYNLIELSEKIQQL